MEDNIETNEGGFFFIKLTTTNLIYNAQYKIEVKSKAQMLNQLYFILKTF